MTAATAILGRIHRAVILVTCAGRKKHFLGGRLGYFLFFLLGGSGVLGGRKGARFGFLSKIPEGGGGSQGEAGGGARGQEGVCMELGEGG